MPSSPHPKSAAIVAVIVALGTAAQALLDGNPATTPDWSNLALTLTLAYGVFMSRQNNVTSEMAGAKPPQP